MKQFLFLFLLIPYLVVSQNINQKNKEVSFSVIEMVPVYPGCVGDNTALKKCMSKKISKHIAQKFNIGLANSLGLSPGKKRIIVLFIIGKTGEIEDVSARAPNIELEKEAIRIIKLLPQMIPGQQKGKAVRVKYGIPIYFHVKYTKEQKLYSK